MAAINSPIRPITRTKGFSDPDLNQVTNQVNTFIENVLEADPAVAYGVKKDCYWDGNNHVIVLDYTYQDQIDTSL